MRIFLTLLSHGLLFAAIGLKCCEPRIISIVVVVKTILEVHRLPGTTIVFYAWRLRIRKSASCQQVSVAFELNYSELRLLIYYLCHNRTLLSSLFNNDLLAVHDIEALGGLFYALTVQVEDALVLAAFTHCQDFVDSCRSTKSDAQ